MIKDVLQDVNWLKDEIFSRLTIDYNNQNFQSQLDDIDYIVMKLKSELSNWKTLSKNWKEQLTVNAMIDRMMKEQVSYSYIKNGKKLYNTPPTTMELKEYVNLLENDFNRIKFYKSKNKFNNEFFKVKKEISPIKKFAVLMYTDNFVNEFYKFSNDSNCRELIDLYILCLKKSNNNIRKNKEAIYKLLDKIFDDLKIDYSLADQQIVKYINQKIVWRCLDLYTHSKENYKRKKEKEILKIKSIIKSSRLFILSNWFGFDTREIKTNDDILNMTYLNKNQKEFIIKVLNVIRDNSNNIEYHKNIKGEYDISKAWACKLLDINYNSFKNKVSRIKNKNKLEGIEPFDFNICINQIDKLKCIE